jgi:hypothetical protein
MGERRIKGCASLVSKGRFFRRASPVAQERNPTRHTRGHAGRRRTLNAERRTDLLDDVEPGETQSLYGVNQLPVSDQHIVCFVSGDRENAYVGLCQRDSNRDQNPDKIQIERTFYLEPSPTSTGARSSGDESVFTNDTKFLSGAAD